MNHDSQFLAWQAADLMERQPQEIARLGQLVEAEVPANGKGYRALYSFRNLVEMRIAEELGRFGVPQKRIQKYLSDLNNSHMRWLEENGLDGYIVLDRLSRWSAGTTLELAFEALGYQIPVCSAVVINLGLIKKALRLRLNRMQ